MKIEQTECSETSVYKLQTPGNYPKKVSNIPHLSYKKQSINIVEANNRCTFLQTHKLWCGVCEIQFLNVRSGDRITYIVQSQHLKVWNITDNLFGYSFNPVF